MSLGEVQNLLARLYTDKDFRLLFLSEPQRIGKENNLSESEISQISQILPQQLEFFSNSLIHKRLHEVEKLLPLTCKALNEDFARNFQEFSKTFLPNSIKKHLEDAVEFASFLTEKNIKPEYLADLIRFEQTRLLFNGYSKQFILRRFHYDIREIVRQLTNATGEPLKQIPQRKTLAVWFRAGKNRKPLHFVW